MEARPTPKLEAGMSEMIERIARVLCDGNWDAASFKETASGDEPEEQREYWREKARAAIEAMREPTEEMLTAGSPYCVDSLAPDYKSGREDAGHCFRAMIDAALSPVSDEKGDHSA
jgi:hypothetical protein